MNNKTLLFCIVLLNIGMIFLLVHKQNKIIKALYELQQLQEQKEALVQDHKKLTLADQKGQQLAQIQNYAKNDLHMTSMTLKEATVL